MKNNMNWNFDNSYSRLSDAFKEHIEPIAVKNPELVLMNEDLIEELNLDFSKIDKNELAALFSPAIFFRKGVMLLLRLMLVTNLDILQC